MLVTSKQIKTAFNSRGQKNFFKPLFNGAKEIDLTPELIAPVLRELCGFNHIFQLARSLDASDTHYAKIKQAQGYYQEKGSDLQVGRPSTNAPAREANRAEYWKLNDQYFKIVGKEEKNYRVIRELAIDQACADYEMTLLHEPSTNRNLAFMREEIAISVAKHTYNYNAATVRSTARLTTIDSPRAAQLDVEYKQLLRECDQEIDAAYETLIVEVLNNIAGSFIEIIAEKIV